MSTEHFVRIFAGAFMLASLALGVGASPVSVNAIYLGWAVLVGAALLQSGFTRLCPLESLLCRPGARCAGSCA